MSIYYRLITINMYSLLHINTQLTMLQSFAMGNHISREGLKMNALQYLAAVKEKKGITSDYALAKTLGVSQQSVGQWRKGVCGFNDETAQRIAAILDLHPGVVMLDIHREQARDDQTRAVWQEIFAGFRKLLPHANSGVGVSPAW
jgi:DNA-binding XRE family transcriptional regulator